MLDSIVSNRDPRAPHSKIRVIVVLGAGGAGKTTVSAGVALSAARSGSRTLYLTLEPAYRVARAFGLSEISSTSQVVSRGIASVSAQGLEAPLTALRLDTRSTFDGVVARYGRDQREVSRIIQHPLYQALSRIIAGTQPYMMMIQVLELMESGKFDLIVLDSASLASGLAFLDTPVALQALVRSPATRVLLRTAEQASRMRGRFLSGAINRAMRGLERVTGARLMAELSQLLSMMRGIVEGLERRGAEMASRLQQGQLGCVLVTSQGARSVLESVELIEQVRNRSLPLLDLVLNKWRTEDSLDELSESLRPEVRRLLRCATGYRFSDAEAGTRAASDSSSQLSCRISILSNYGPKATDLDELLAIAEA